MYKNDIKRGDSYRFGEYAMAPGLDLTPWYNAVLAKMKQIFQEIEDAGEGKKVTWIYGESFNDQPQSAILTYWDDSVNIPLTEDGSVIQLGGTVDTESEEVILDGTSSLIELSDDQLNSIENNEVRISTQQAEQLMNLIRQLYGYHLPHIGYIPVQPADPFADSPEGFREMMTKLGATSLEGLTMECDGIQTIIYGGNDVRLIVGKDFNVVYSGGGD